MRTAVAEKRGWFVVEEMVAWSIRKPTHEEKDVVEEIEEMKGILVKPNKSFKSNG